MTIQAVLVVRSFAELERRRFRSGDVGEHYIAHQTIADLLRCFERDDWTMLLQGEIVVLVCDVASKAGFVQVCCRPAYSMG